MSASGLDGRPVIIGGGIAGLLTALHLAPEPVVILSKAPLGTETSSGWAQGGLAASFASNDSPDLHLNDTLAAGDGLCDERAVRRIVEAAPGAVDALSSFGVHFDRASDGQPRLGLEAAHSRRRIVHAGGDGSGREVMRALVSEVRSTPSITVIEGAEARRLAVEEDEIRGVWAASARWSVFFASDRVIIATGGIGGLFSDSTNPLQSFGQGLALAARAGAVLSDLEFVQFHPTAIDGSGRPMALISEAVRGEGAVLIDETGYRFLGGIEGAELAPRDIVARGVWNELARGHRVFLDGRSKPGRNFAKQFPTIAAACRKLGLDPAHDPIPIRPAQHYHMGGIAVDERGRTSIKGLWACGEVASTGLHGANRLASNSLTEAVVCSRWIADDVGGLAPRPTRHVAMPIPPSPDPALTRASISATLGVVREAEGLRSTARALFPIARRLEAESDPATVGLMIAISALRRQESRGAHYRSDFPHHSANAVRSRITLQDALAAGRDLVEAPSLESLTS